MKICVCSDSHGNSQGIKRMLLLEKPDGLIFCGDGLDDIKGIKVPDIFCAVRGNCDFFCKAPDIVDTVLAGVHIIASHGHRYAVKNTKDIYLSEAFAREAKVAVFGHTHAQVAEYHAGVLLLNPGTMSRYNEYYALLFLENGVCDCRLERLKPSLE